jgi:hypothetical protein
LTRDRRRSLMPLVLQQLPREARDCIRSRHRSFKALKNELRAAVSDHATAHVLPSPCF